MIWFTQASNKSPMKYTEALWNKAFKRNRAYDENVLKAILIEGLSE